MIMKATLNKKWLTGLSGSFVRILIFDYNRPVTLQGF